MKKIILDVYNVDLEIITENDNIKVVNENILVDGIMVETNAKSSKIEEYDSREEMEEADIIPF